MRYKAMDQDGRRVTGQLEAANAADLEARLARLGLDLITCREARAGRTIGGGRVRRGDLVGFCFHMEQLVTAGVPVIEGLETLRDSAGNPRLREVLAAMVESVEGGETLSGAMREHPAVFGAVFVNLVRAGELSGRMGEILGSLNEHLKWQNEQLALARRLLTYPAIAGAVVPARRVLPDGLSGAAARLLHRGHGEGAATAHPGAHPRLGRGPSRTGISCLLRPSPSSSWCERSAGSAPPRPHAVDDWKLRVWVVGPILRKIILARFAGSFALLYASGITVLECIRICEGLAGNRAIEDATHRAGRKIAEGAGISAGLRGDGAVLAARAADAAAPGRAPADSIPHC